MEPHSISSNQCGNKMKLLTTIFTLLPFLSSAQRDLRNDSHSWGYVPGKYAAMPDATSILYKDSLYKNIDMRAFLKKEGLITEDFVFYEQSGDILKIVKDTSIKFLFVFKEE